MSAPVGGPYCGRGQRGAKTSELDLLGAQSLSKRELCSAHRIWDTGQQWRQVFAGRSLRTFHARTDMEPVRDGIIDYKTPAGTMEVSSPTSPR